MALQVCKLVPEKAGYTVVDGDGALRVQHEGPRARYREDDEGDLADVSVSFLVEGAGLVYWRAFYRTGTKRGSLPFLIDLAIDGAVLTRHKAWFVPGTVKMVSAGGLAYRVTCQLDVTPAAN
jgi:hypothetical protein